MFVCLSLGVNVNLIKHSNVRKEVMFVIIIMLVYILQFTTKQLERFSKKCEKEEKAQQAKVKKVAN